MPRFSSVTRPTFSGRARGLDEQSHPSPRYMLSHRYTVDWISAPARHRLSPHKLSAKQTQATLSLVTYVLTLSTTEVRYCASKKKPTRTWQESNPPTFHPNDVSGTIMMLEIISISSANDYNVGVSAVAYAVMSMSYLWILC